MRAGIIIPLFTPLKPFETRDELNVVVATQNRLDSVLFRELTDLLATLDYRICKVFYQNSSRRNPRYFMGKGKLREITEYIRENRVELVIIDHNLRPGQIYNAQALLETDVFDRVRVILEIFVRHARSVEAKLQVELATLKYEIPLVREWIHQSRTGEHPGFLGGGEFQVTQYLDGIRKRSAAIEVKLGSIKKTRQLRRDRKKKDGKYIVSLAGYTNAGKTSLLCSLTTGEGDIRDRFFTTLSTRTRRLADSPLPVFVTDTIGFIQYLPPFLVAAFRSTLEEIFFSDVIILVVDVSDDMEEIARKMITSFDILSRESGGPPVICALNKTDITDTDILADRVEEISLISEETGFLVEEHIPCSAVEGTGIGELVRAVRSRLPDLEGRVLVVDDIIMHPEVESELRGRFEVLEEKTVGAGNGDSIAFKVRGNLVEIERFVKEHAMVVNHP